jgi:hypothetical protein
MRNAPAVSSILRRNTVVHTAGKSPTALLFQHPAAPHSRPQISGVVPLRRAGRDARASASEKAGQMQLFAKTRRKLSKTNQLPGIGFVCKNNLSSPESAGEEQPCTIVHSPGRLRTE